MRIRPTLNVGSGATLAVVCLATLAITVDTTIMNITLPTLVREMDADTADLQWIVDAYNLAFAALVLAAGGIADRCGRRGALVGGLAVFAAGSAAGSQAATVTSLLGARVVMGVGAAFVFPATLSIISNLYADRASRAKAIGVWGATGGLGVALGPVTGGWLLSQFWWGVSFLAMVPVAVVAMLLALVAVPETRDRYAPPLDRLGLGLSVVAVGTLVWAIIEAPDKGWTSASTLAAIGGATMLGAVFVRHERRAPHAMLDLGLFRNPRFTAASGAIAAAFFSLFGFIFLITQYFQFVRGYTPFGAGVRQVPVALAIVIGSIGGARLAVRIGNNLTTAGGLTMLAVAFTWAATASAVTPYTEIVGQMLLIGIGMGATSATATEAIMGAVPPGKAGIGSAINDSTRELGGTLGVAVVGSVFASSYGAAVGRLDSVTSPTAADTIRGSFDAAVGMAKTLSADGQGPLAEHVLLAARNEFFDGYQFGCLVAAAVAFGGAIFVGLVLPAHPRLDEPTTSLVGHHT